MFVLFQFFSPIIEYVLEIRVCELICVGKKFFKIFGIFVQRVFHFLNYDGRGYSYNSKCEAPASFVFGETGAEYETSLLSPSTEKAFDRNKSSDP